MNEFSISIFVTNEEKRCSIDSCERKYLARGFCRYHYQRDYHSRPLAAKNRYRTTPHGWQVNTRVKLTKMRAKNQGHEWALTNIEAADIVSRPCEYCGQETQTNIQAWLTDPETGRSVRNRKSGAVGVNGIDRVDSSLGYVPGNCVSACGTCNRAKNALSVEEFDSWLAKAYHHRHVRRNERPADRDATEAQVPSAQSSE